MLEQLCALLLVRVTSDGPLTILRVFYAGGRAPSYCCSMERTLTSWIQGSVLRYIPPATMEMWAWLVPFCSGELMHPYVLIFESLVGGSVRVLHHLK